MATRKTVTPNPTKPKFMVVELYNLHYQTNAGQELVLNFDIPTGILLKANTNGMDEPAMITAVLDAMGDEKNKALYASLGWFSEGQAVTERYFAEFEKLTGTSAGE